MAELLLRHRQFLVFVSGGVMCALVDIGVMQALIGSNVNVLVATSVGFLAGLGLNYLFHARLTFNAAMSAHNMARYLCVVALNFCITLAMVALSVALIDAALPGKLASLPVVAINGFLLSKHWIFK